MTGFTTPTSGMPWIAKDPNAVLDYKVLWADWLDDDTITGVSFTVPTGLVKDDEDITDTMTSATVWLSGGTAGTNYRVICHITTAGGREEDRSFDVRVKQR